MLLIYSLFIEYFQLLTIFNDLTQKNINMKCMDGILLNNLNLQT